MGHHGGGYGVRGEPLPCVLFPDFTYMETLASDGGQSGARITAFKALQARITSKCPKDFAVTQCAVQSMRKHSGGYAATCAGQCTDYAAVASDDACGCRISRPISCPPTGARPISSARLHARRTPMGAYV